MKALHLFRPTHVLRVRVISTAYMASVIFGSLSPAIAGAAEVPSCIAGNSFDSFTVGSVNGQDGWSATNPAYDQAIVNNTYDYPTFGCKSLRLSDAVSSGSFGDWIFTNPLDNAVGETAATTGGYGEGTRKTHFETQFDIATTVPGARQPGLHASVSPDRGDGSRMSYLRFEDGTAGLEVFFDDVTSSGIAGSDTFRETQIAGGTAPVAALNRTVPHTVRLTLDAVDGPSNDVVKVYLDGALVHTGTSWEDYFRFDAEAAPENSPRIIRNMIIQVRGSSTPANLGNGFLFDNVSMNVSPVTVSINKYINGVKATATTANSSAFPMASTWTAANVSGGVEASGTYELTMGNNYEAATSPMDAGANYTTHEVTGGSVVGADCSTGQPYMLEGYKSGNTVSDAEAATLSATPPSFTNITENKVILVQNKMCISAPTHISPTDNSTKTTAELDKIDWSDVADPALPISYVYEVASDATTKPDGSFVSPIYTSGTLFASEIGTAGTAEGIYHWHVRATDSAGNTSPWSSQWTVSVSNVPVVTCSDAVLPTSPNLGVAAGYVILASSYVNTTTTTINGDIGFQTGPAVTPLGTHAHYGSGVPYSTAGTDQGTALATLAGKACTFTFADGAIDLSTDTTHGTVGVYPPGVYCSNGAMNVGGSLTLSGNGTFVFRPVGALTSTDGSAVVSLNGASAYNVFWTPTEAVTLGSNTAFAGIIIDDAGITAGANTTFTGLALSFGGTVTTNTATFSKPACDVIAPISCIPSDAGLVSYWQFDENTGTTVNDPAGTNEIGTINGALWTSMVAPLDFTSVSALSFNGVSDAVEVAGGGNLNNLQTGSISLWVRWNGVQDGGYSNYGHVIARQRDGIFSNDLIALNGADPATAKIVWLPYDHSSVAATSTISPGNGAWRHVTVTFRNGDHRIYVDGVLEGTGNNTGTVTDDASVPLSIGAWLGDGAEFSGTTIDDVRVYNRVLQPSEVAALNGGSCSVPAPVCGNTVTEGPETCDDGNTADGDGCSSQCLVQGSSSSSSSAPADSDSDGVADSTDNCPLVANADQIDTDADTVGDVCDNCPINANPSQTDANDNGVGDVCDTGGSSSSSSSSPAACLPTDEDLVAYWKFDESDGSSTVDSTTLDNHGTLTGGVSFTSSVPPLIGFTDAYVASFDGVNGVVGVTPDTGLAFDTTNAFSMTAWVNPAANGGYQTVAQKMDDTGGAKTGYLLTLSNGVPELWLLNDYSANNYFVATSSVTLTPGTWQHIAVSYDGSGNATGVKMYVNGSDITAAPSVNALTGTITNAQPFEIGARAAGTIQPFNGSIDDLRVYNTALSPARIAALGTGSCSGDGSSSSSSSSVSSSSSSSDTSCLPADEDLVGYWKFDESDSSLAIDSTTYNNQGAVSGAAPGGAGAPVSYTNTTKLSFDGVSNQVNVTDVTGLPSGNGARTVVLWMNQAVMQQQSTLVSLGSGNTPDQKFIVQMGTEPAGGPTYLFTDGINEPNNITVTGTEIPGIGWHHVAFSYDGAGNWEYYLDGLLKKSGVFPVAINTVTNAAIVGARNDAVSGFFNGSLDDVRIFNSALSPFRIAALASGICTGSGGGSSSSSSSEGGSSSSSSSSSSEGGSSSSSSQRIGPTSFFGGPPTDGGGNGGHRGHRTNVYAGASDFLASVLGNDDNLPPGGFGGGDLPIGGFGGGPNVPFSSIEMNYICSMRSSIPRDAVDAFVVWLGTYMADIMGRDADQVVDALNDTSLCIPTLRSDLPKAIDSVVRVNKNGFVVSTNPVWNVCTQHPGLVTSGLIKSNRDTTESRQGSTVTVRPLTCSDYHKNNLNIWKHPDHPGLEVTLDANGRLTGTLAAGYVAVRDGALNVADNSDNRIIRN
ncbi:MAG: ice-binding family protein [Candidatus Peribacteraceae bacterium]|nr:ice-binding family protein [Candidatus Peribacteraceae bacterium]